MALWELKHKSVYLFVYISVNLFFVVQPNGANMRNKSLYHLVTVSIIITSHKATEWIIDNALFHFCSNFYPWQIEDEEDIMKP